MKIKFLALMTAFSLSAHAQYMGTLPPVADGRIFYSEDTDHFKTRLMWVGANVESGFGVRIGNVEYSAPTLNSSGTILQGTYINVGENYDFHGAIGVKKLTHYTNLNKAGNTLADQIIAKNPSLDAADQSDIRRDAPSWAGDQIVADGGKVNGTKDYLVADAELRLVMTDSLTLGLTAATDVVDSVKSIQTGTTYFYVGGDADLLLTDNLSFSIAAGNVHFSDSNDRQVVRTKTTWTFLPEYGVSTYLRTKNQVDSNAGSPNYYSPENLNEQAIGIQIRKPYEGLVYNAGVDYGIQRALLSTGEKTQGNVYVWQLGIQTQPGKKNGITYGASLTGTNNSLTNGSSSNYNWYGFNTWIKVPF